MMGGNGMSVNTEIGEEGQGGRERVQAGRTEWLEGKMR